VQREGCEGKVFASNRIGENPPSGMIEGSIGNRGMV